MYKSIIPKLLAEFIGTFFLVFIACGSMILTELNIADLSTFIPVVFGATVAVMIYCVGHISGAHFNPAVTIAFSAIGKFDKKGILPYILAQTLGAIFASYVHSILYGFDHTFGATLVKTTLLNMIILEFIFTFLLMFVITSVATDSRAVGELAGLAIGFSVMLAAFVGGPSTGASLNPARTIGPAIFNGNFSYLILYILVPIIAAISGALSYQKIKCDLDKTDEDNCC